MKFVWYAALLLALFISSCKKEGINTIYVPASLKQMLPYSNNKKVRFGNSAGYSFESTVLVTQNFIVKSNCSGCPPYVREEYINYELVTGQKIFAQLSIDNRPVIFMSVFSPFNFFESGSGFDFETVAGSPAPVCSGIRQRCIDSKTLNGVVYDNVLEIISGATEPDKIVKAYYTVDKGLIGFEFGDGVVMYLL